LIDSSGGVSGAAPRLNVARRAKTPKLDVVRRARTSRLSLSSAIAQPRRDDRPEPLLNIRTTLVLLLTLLDGAGVTAPTMLADRHQPIHGPILPVAR
jgi:hypothetical protein